MEFAAEPSRQYFDSGRGRARPSHEDESLLVREAGAARDVLVIGEMDDPHPQAGDVRVRVAFSGINTGDVKKREDAFGVGMPYPRVIPHSVGSGTVDAVGDGVWRDWIGRSRLVLWGSVPSSASSFDRFRSRWRYCLTCQESMDGAK
jgi:threonine dehydrogenase-like Zn-dependent dehydrogenase